MQLHLICSSKAALPPRASLQTRTGLGPGSGLERGPGWGLMSPTCAEMEWTVSLPAGITLLGKGHGLSAGISGLGREVGMRKEGRGCLQLSHTRPTQRALCTYLWTKGTPGEGASYSADMGPPRPGIRGQPLGPWLGRYRGKEARLGQNGLLKPAYDRGRPLAQVAERQPSQAPEKPEAQPWFVGASSLGSVTRC